MTTAWPKGSMRFEFRSPPGNVKKKYISREGEPPSTFIARILKDREKKGATIYQYLKQEMDL
ncbi:MAG: hypothetical protein DRP09_10595 [Candidatus Thorarchaeota archaeon]|nr:MAG: hypothetical protein DRP09_10595 [Candidatus Thorarchaeota archaeon]